MLLFIYHGCEGLTFNLRSSIWYPLVSTNSRQREGRSDDRLIQDILFSDKENTQM